MPRSTRPILTPPTMRTPLGLSARGGALAAALYLATGCYAGVNQLDDPQADSQGPSADDHDGASDGADDPDLDPAHSASGSRLWRLTWTQYDQTIQELLGDPSLHPSADFDEDLLINAEHGFTNEARSLRISDRVTRQLGSAAEAIAEEVVERQSELLPCAPATADDAECVAAFVDTFGRTAWHRPLTAEEHGRLIALYEAGVEESGGSLGLAMVVEAILRSPHFLFRLEVGTPGEDPSQPWLLEDHEIAAALSYTLWNRPPDAELRSLADEQQLQDPDVRAQQVRRMMDDPRAHSAFFTFVPDWLGLVPAARLNKDTGTFPEFTEAAAQQIEQGTRSFLAEVLSNDGRLDTLLTASYAFAGPDSAWIYGDDATPTGQLDEAGLERLELDPDRRMGLLTQAGFLASHASAVDSSFVNRGLVMAERLGCFSPPTIPPDLDPQLPPPTDDLPTARDRFEYATSPAECSGCHESFTPLGFALETFDAVGSYRTLDNGSPIDTTGLAMVLKDLDDRTFSDGLELSAMLASSETVQACVATQMFRYVYGREEHEADEPLLEEVTEHFQEHDLDLRELLVALVTDERFILRTPDTQD